MLASLLPVAILALSIFLQAPVDARKVNTKNDFAALQHDAAKRFAGAGKRHGPELDKRSRTPGSGVKNITFTNPLASQFYVNGTLPLMDFNSGPSWSGLLPISKHPDETRKLFFWFFPPGPEGSLDDLIFWTNGGPGCSSLEGVLQENGPFSWSWGQAQATVNEYSWTNLSSVLYLEQPVGTGFTQGTPSITNEFELAEQVVGFLGVFLDIFSELKGMKLWLSGESYAGYYVPYIADNIYSNPGQIDLNLQGIWISDPTTSWDVVQSEIPAVNFVHKYADVFAFNQSYMDALDAQAARCNYTDYFDKYVTYPPAGLLPLPGNSVESARGCDVWDDILIAALLINPAFNIYRIFDTYPILWDVLGFPGTFAQTQVSPLYFNRQDVKEAIHAPVDVDWVECSNENVFAGDGNDNSVPSSLSVLPGVIEKSHRTVIVHGLADFILIAEGTRIVIQNMTWGGLQGFQTPIQNDSFIVDGMGAMGTTHTERGLTYVEVALSGHMIPQFSPVAAFQIMSYLMGFRENPSD